MAVGTRALPELAADLTYIKVNGGVANTSIACWEEDYAPVTGMDVLAAGGSSTKHKGRISEIWDDGTLVIRFSQFAHAVKRAS